MNSESLRRFVSRLPVCGFCLGVLLHSTGAAAEQVYKYNESGTTTYQDRAPSSEQDDGHEVLNQQGLVVNTVLSREERRKARAEAERVRLEKIRDRALLASFTTEDDLIRTRDDRIGMIDGLISRLDERIRILSERLMIVDERIADQEQALGPEKAQESLYIERLSIQRNIENAWSLIDAKASERATLSEKFEDDLMRYRELKSGR